MYFSQIEYQWHVYMNSNWGVTISMQPMWLSYFAIFNLYSILEHILGRKNINTANILWHFQQIVIFLNIWKTFWMQSMWLVFFQGIVIFTNHLKMHYVEKQNTFQIKTYHCSQCDWPFSRNSNLTSHFKIHSGEKPNQCNVTWVSERRVV